MGAQGQPSDELVTFAGGVLDRHRHVCAFSDGSAEDESVLDPFVRQGIERGDRIVYLVDPAQSGRPADRLEQLGFDSTALVDSKFVEVKTWAETYLQGGEFNKSSMLQLLDLIFDDRDSPRVRLVADMGWAVESKAISGDLVEFEARANFVNLRHRHIAICWYDVSKFDGSLVIDILRTHPMVLIGGLLQENPFFVPPAEFLRQRNLPAGRESDRD